MGGEQNRPDVEKLLTYVFERGALLPSTTLTLADGLFLAPIPDFLLEQDDNARLQTVDSCFSRFFRGRLHCTTLNVAYSGRSDVNYEGKGSGEPGAYAKANHYVLAAMLHTPQFVPPYACFVTIPTQEQVCHSNRMMDFEALDGGQAQPLRQDDFATVNNIYGSVREVLTTDATGRLPTALSYYQQAFRVDISWPVRFVSMMMGIEAMFSHGASEIAHQVAERAAFFLKQDAPDREQVYQQMRDFYKLRSKIAHGGTARGNAQGLSTSFRELLLMLRGSLVKVLTDSFLLDLFQNTKGHQFNKAMKDLIFHGRIQRGAP